MLLRSLEQRLTLLFDVLAEENIPAPPDAPAIATLLATAYTLETGLVASDYSAFRSAASSAAVAAGSAHRLDASTNTPSSQLLASWACQQLPGLGDILSSYVERSCDSNHGLDLAVALQEAAQRKRNVHVQIQLDELLSLPPDEARRRLKSSIGSSAAAPDISDAAAAPASEPITPSSSSSSSLMGPEWLWLVSHAIGLPASSSDSLSHAAAWSLLFSSSTDGRSLHTLNERIAGYAHGTLLVCKDQAEFVFAGWAARGLNPSPPSASAPPRDPDFTGTEQSLLIRLRPSLLVCRTRRALSQAAKATPRSSSSASSEPSVPADGRFLYFNNRHKAKRGVGFGGSLKQSRLYFDASLEAVVVVVFWRRRGKGG